MSLISIASMVFIAAGAVVMALSIQRSRSLLRVLREISEKDTAQLRSFFKFHEVLMVVFLLGYAAVLYAIMADLHLTGDLFVGMIFFLGAVFVLIGIILKSKMLSSLKDMVDREVAAGERLKAESEKLTAANQDLLKEIQVRKRAEKEKKQLKRKLARSQRMEALGLLAGGVAHDLNNVLSGTVSYPDLLLLDLPEDSPLREPILTIQDSGKKAAAIVQDLLTLARRGVMTAEVVNLNAIVDQYRRSPEHRKIMAFHPMVDLEVDLDPGLKNIEGSPVHLKKTVMNLVANAAEAHNGDGTIVVTTRNQFVDSPVNGDEDMKVGEYVVLTVADDGIGIDPRDLDRIFEPFYTKKVMGRSGTGLGMSVVWGTVQDHRGYITVESDLGKGTRFELYFPATRKAIEVRPGAMPISAYTGRGETILVVDDSEKQRQIVAGLLAKLNYTIATVASGEAAVEYLKTNPTDLVILDMIMDPGMDGLDTYREIIKAHPRQGAIIATGYSETERVREAVRLGVRGYVKKPYTLEEIGIVLRKAFKRQMSV